MRNKTRMLVEAGLLIAVAQILRLHCCMAYAPRGICDSWLYDSHNHICYSLGCRARDFAGAVYGILQFILGPKYSFHIVSLLFDYPIAFAGLGLAGLNRKNYFTISVGIFLGILVRYLSHVISGAIVFYEYAGTQNPWIYSLVYNSTYLIPELVISVVVIGLYMGY